MNDFFRLIWGGIVMLSYMIAFIAAIAILYVMIFATDAGYTLSLLTIVFIVSLVIPFIDVK